MKYGVFLAAAVTVLTLFVCVTISDDADAEGSSQYTSYEGSVYTFAKNSSGSSFWSDLVSYSGTEALLMVQGSLEGYPLETIRASAFGDGGIEAAVVPPTVREIGAGAFVGCASLRDLYFMGDMPVLGTGALGKATVHYLQRHSESWAHYTGSKVVVEQVSSGSVLYFLIEGRAYAGGNDGGRDVVISSSATIGGSRYPVASVMPYSFFADEGIESVEVSEGVTTIEERAFMYCKNLSSLTLPSTLRTIDSEAFRMGVPSSESDGSLSSLEDLTLPDGLKYMGFECFRMTFHLRNVEVPDSVTSYCEGAFRACYSLESVSFGAGVGDIPQWSFDNCYRLRSVSASSRIVSVGSSAFYGDRSLEWLDFPGGGPKSVGASAFAGCSALTAFPSSVLSHIGPGAFRNCGSLRAIALPDSVSIGEKAFSDSGLEAVSLSGPLHIGRGAFSTCRCLGGIDVTGSSMYSSADGVLYEGSELACFPLGKTCGCFSVREGTASVAEEAFMGARIRSLNVPDSVKSVGERAFAGSELKEATIGKGISFIGDRAFYGCGQLGAVHFEGGAPEFGAHVFGNVADGFAIYYDAQNANSWKGSGIGDSYSIAEWKREPGGGHVVAIALSALLFTVALLAFVLIAKRRRI